MGGRYETSGFSGPVMDMCEDSTSDAASFRKRPPRLDFSRLFPRPQAPGGALLSPNMVTKSPSLLSFASDFSPRPPSHPADSFPWEDRKSGVVPLTPHMYSTYATSAVEPRFRSRVSIKRVKQGVNQWFNGSNDETPFYFRQQDYEFCINPTEGQRRHPGITSTRSSEIVASNGLCANQGPPKPNLSSRVATHDNLSTPLRESNPQTGAADNLQSPRSVLSSTSQRSDWSAFTGSDLQNQSILALSSSEDEDEISPTRKKHANRLSRNTDKHHSEPNFAIEHTAASDSRMEYTRSKSLSAALVSPTRTFAGKRTSLGGDCGNTSTFLLTSSTTSPKHLISSQDRHKEMISNEGRHGLCNATMPATNRLSLAESNSQPQPSPTTDGTLGQPRRRMMAVTKEEELLLEAMRQKKAAMREGRLGQRSRRLSEQRARREVDTNLPAGPTVDMQKSKPREARLSAITSVSLPGPTQKQPESISPRTDHSPTEADVAHAPQGPEQFRLLHVSKDVLPDVHFSPPEYQASTPPGQPSPPTPPSDQTSSMIFIEGTDNTDQPLPKCGWIEASESHPKHVRR